MAAPNCVTCEDLMSRVPTKKRVDVGTIHATGYVIRKATINIVSSDDIEGPENPVEVELVADMVWVNKSDDSWVHGNSVSLNVDLDREEFILDGKEVEIINGKQIFNRVMKVLVGSIQK